MPSKKRKYNARFPAGRIKKIMQTDEEVGKVAQAVPIIILVTPRTLELFVESLLGKALTVTSTRNAKTLSPSHVKQCILAEARFDFLRDLVKNIPDVSAAEEKELMSAETSPNSSSRFAEAAAPAPRRVLREDSGSSSGGEPLPAPPAGVCTRDQLKRALSDGPETPNKTLKLEPDTPGTSVTFDPIPPGTSVMSPVLAKIKQKILTHSDMTVSPLKLEPDAAIDLSKKETRPVRTANFYHETLVDEAPHRSVIQLNPTYSTPQPSTSYKSLSLVEPLRIMDAVPKPAFERHNSLPSLPRTPITPVINIDFSKNLARPEIKVLDATAGAANVVSVPKHDRTKHLSRQNTKNKMEVKKVESKPAQQIPIDIDSLNSGNLQIDEDYDT